MKKVFVLLVILVLALTIVPITPALADDITVYANPSYLEFGSTPASWTINNATGSGSGLIDENTTYYANPSAETSPPSATVTDGQCYFTWSNNSSVNIEITVNCGSFTGGDCAMTNSNSGSNGATTYGAYSWYSGCNYAGNKTVIKSSGSDVLYTTATPGEDKKWGCEITTRTNTWTGTTGNNATMTITAAEA